MPYHVALDRANEARLAGAKVGTTGRGIGPTYGDRAWRLGLRMEDLLDREVLRERIGRALAGQEPASSRRWARRAFAVEPLVEQAAAWGERLRDAPRRLDLARPGRAPARRPRPPRGRAGHAPRPRPRQLPVRHLLQPGRGRRVHRRRHRAAPGRRGHRRHEGVLDPRRLRPVPDRAARRRSGTGSPSAATSSAPSPAGRAGSAGSTRCRCATRSP